MKKLQQAVLQWEEHSSSVLQGKERIEGKASFIVREKTQSSSQNTTEHSTVKIPDL